jgi:hypothetical protein
MLQLWNGGYGVGTTVYIPSLSCSINGAADCPHIARCCTRWIRTAGADESSRGRLVLSGTANSTKEKRMRQASASIKKGDNTYREDLTLYAIAEPRNIGACRRR